MANCYWGFFMFVCITVYLIETAQDSLDLLGNLYYQDFGRIHQRFYF